MLVKTIDPQIDHQNVHLSFCHTLVTANFHSFAMYQLCNIPHHTFKISCVTCNLKESVLDLVDNSIICELDM